MFAITKSDIRSQVKRAVSLVITDSHFNLPQEFVWVYMGKHTHFITLEGSLLRRRGWRMQRCAPLKALSSGRN